MITLGVDAHKEVHVAVAADEQGRPLETWEGPNSEAAWQELLAWAGQWECRQWGPSMSRSSTTEPPEFLVQGPTPLGRRRVETPPARER